MLDRETPKRILETHDRDDIASDAAPSSFVMQNKGGLLAAIAGAVVGLITGNPLLMLVGLAGGFITGSAVAEHHGAVIGRRGDEAAQKTVPSRANDAESRAANPSDLSKHASSAVPAAAGIVLDPQFSQENGSPVAAPSLPAPAKPPLTLT